MPPICAAHEGEGCKRRPEGGLSLHRWQCSMMVIVLWLLVTAVAPVRGAVTNGPSNLALGRPYRVEVAWPDPLYTEQEDAYPDTHMAELTDGVKAAPLYSDAPWRVFVRQGGRSIYVDLGAAATIYEMGANFLQSHPHGVYVPRYVDFALSVDGTTWIPVGRVESAVGPWNRRIQTETMRLTGLSHVARYVRIRFPVDVMVMMDELEVVGTFSREPGAIDVSELPAPTTVDWRDAAVLGPEMLPPRGFLPAGADAAGGARHIALAIYAYPPNPEDGEWTAADYLPYVAYVDEKGEAVDWMFDTVLLTPQGSTPTGRKLAGNTPDTAATAEEWRWYVEETFRPGRQVEALNEAAAAVKKALGDPNYKVKVILTLPNPSPAQADFGSLEPEGTPLNLDWQRVGIERSVENRLTAVRWLLDSLLERWNDLAPEHLELIGFWWHMESVGFADAPQEDVFLNRVGDMVRARGYRFFWIPYYGAPGSYDWHNYGFDAAILQPNYMFADVDETRLRLTAQIARTLGMGVEMEKHWNFSIDTVYRWVDYLDGGAKYGYDAAVIGYYQNYKDFGRAGTVSDQTARTLFYDYVYDFINGRFAPPATLRR